MKKNKSLNDLSNAGYKFAVIKIDETEYWQEDIAKASGKIYGVYLVELGCPTHCCSLSVSYPSENIKNFFPTPPANLDEDTLTEYEMFGEYLREDTLYLDGYSVYEVAKLYRKKDGDKDTIMDYEAGNPTVC